MLESLFNAYYYVFGFNGKAFKYDKITDGDWQHRKQELENENVIL